MTSHVLARQSLGESLADAGVMLLLVLLGSTALLAQTRLAQAEHARAAALDERPRLARELHDVPAHSLGALGVQLELAEAPLTERSDVDGALRSIRRSRRLAKDGLAEARDAVAALRQDVPPLTETLAAVVALAGIAREALTNAGKHARGEDIRMWLSQAPARRPQRPRGLHPDR